MIKTLIDAGPIIALFDKSDFYHESVTDFFKNYTGILFTTWPVITEVSHMLDFNVSVQIDLLTWLSRGAITIINLEPDHLNRIIELCRKYSDVPMDLADSSLMVISEITGINKIITLDSDYYIYRTKSKTALMNVFEKYLARKST